MQGEALYEAILYIHYNHNSEIIYFPALQLLVFQDLENADARHAHYCFVLC